MIHMTAPTSPKELLSAYRANARRTASENNKPQKRSDFPGLVLTPTGMIYNRGKRLFYHPTGKAPEGRPDLRWPGALHIGRECPAHHRSQGVPGPIVAGVLAAFSPMASLLWLTFTLAGHVLVMAVTRLANRPVRDVAAGPYAAVSLVASVIATGAFYASIGL